MDFLTIYDVIQPFYCKNAAILAIQYGAAGIIVSNHGARQLDYVPATITALEEVYLFALLIFMLCSIHVNNVPDNHTILNAHNFL